MLRGPPGHLSCLTGCCLTPPPATISCPPRDPRKKSCYSNTPRDETPMTEAVRGPERKSHPHNQPGPSLLDGAGVQKQDPPRPWRPLANACTFYQSEVSLINIFSSPLLRSLIWPEAAQSFKKQSKRQRRKTQVPRGEPGWRLRGHSPEPPRPWCFRTQPHRSGSLLSKGAGTAGPTGGRPLTLH